jgi:deoxyribodipyrimidine photo-lyase
MKTAIVWFRNDLRAEDNEALFRAADGYDRIIPVYCFDEKAIGHQQFGFQKMGPRRLNFILESLIDLKPSLEAKGSYLHIEQGAPAEIISRLAREYGVETVFANREATTEEIEMERSVELALNGISKLDLCWGATLYHIEDLPFALDKLPDVFTQFRKLIEKQAEVRPLFSVNDLPPLPEGFRAVSAFPSITELISRGPVEAEIDSRAAIVFKGGASNAQARLKHYFWETKQLASYKETRNGMLGEAYSSKFSAWLAHGCISPRMIYWEVMRFEQEVKKNSSTYWLIFELIWRDYFRFVALKFGSQLFLPGGIRNERPSMRPNQNLIDAWTSGSTGIPFVDANMRELRETGFMSNRGRQNVASFFVKDLMQDWRIGAAYFEQELIDYDPASNWGNWAYIAGVGNDPREDRYFNMLVQAGRYDANGDYVRHWIPELNAVPDHAVHKPWTQGHEAIAKQGLIDTPYAKPVMIPKGWKL